MKRWRPSLLAVDSNVLLRLLANDDLEQADIAEEFLATVLTVERPGFISPVVVCETVWVLKRVYRYDEARIRDALRNLLAIPQLVFGDETALKAALDGEPDFTDLLIYELGRRAGCSETVTFDRRFARLPGVRLLES